MHRAQRIACGGMDVHYNFSSVSWCDASGRRVARERLAHADREVLRQQIADWPQDVPVVMEASFGWGWLSDELEAAGIDVHLSNCLKVEQMRQARGGVKTNQKDADLLAQLPLEPTAVTRAACCRRGRWRPCGVCCGCWITCGRNWRRWPGA